MNCADIFLVTIIVSAVFASSLGMNPGSFTAQKSDNICEIIGHQRNRSLTLAMNVTAQANMEGTYGVEEQDKPDQNVLTYNLASRHCDSSTYPALVAVDQEDGNARNGNIILIAGKTCDKQDFLYEDKPVDVQTQRTSIVSYQNGVITAFAFAKGESSVREISVNVTITFQIAFDRSIERFSISAVKSLARTCVSSSDCEIWSTEICATSHVNSTAMTCRCKTGSAIAVMTSFDIINVAEIWMVIICATSAVSGGFVLLSVIILIRHRRKLQKDRGYIQINLTSSLFCFRFVFLSKYLVDYSLATESYATACELLIVLFQYFLLTTLLWMLSEGLFLFRNVVLTFRFQGVKGCALIHTICVWLIPILIVVPSAIVGFLNESYVQLSPLYLEARNHIGTTVDDGTPNLNRYRKYYACWSNSGKYNFLLTGVPIAIVMCINVVICIWVLVIICRKNIADRRMRPAGDRRDSAFKESQTQAKTSLFAFLTLMTLLGLNWTLPAIAHFNRNISLAVIIIETMQGIAILIIYCIMNENIRRAVKLDLGIIWRKISKSG